MNYEDYVEEQVSEKDWKIVQKLKKEGKINLNTKIIAKMWVDFVNPEKRKQTEIPFLLKQLKEYNHPRIFDSCAGAGYTSIELKLFGIEDVVSNEIDNDLLRAAIEEAKKHNVSLFMTQYDWRELNEGLFEKPFDAVLNLGNSLTELHKRVHQITSLKNFGRILKPNGKLIIDERNYAERFLKGNGSNYKWAGEVVYCGKDKVDAHPVYISPSMVIMEYMHRERGEKAHLVLYPFKAGELKKLITQVGFKDIKVYGDYKEQFDPKDPEFLTYVCRKI